MHLLQRKPGDMMAAIDMNAQLREWVAKAINDGCMGEEFGFDIHWDLKPPLLYYTVIMTMQNPMLGQGPLVMPVKIPIGAVREDAVRAGVHHLMSELRKLHKQVLDAGPKPVRVSSN
jgi:hypothetical protein